MQDPRMMYQYQMYPINYIGVPIPYGNPNIQPNFPMYNQMENKKYNRNIKKNYNPDTYKK
jgi:hypothetical protein